MYYFHFSFNYHLYNQKDYTGLFSWKWGLVLGTCLIITEIYTVKNILLDFTPVGIAIKHFIVSHDGTLFCNIDLALSYNKVSP